MQGMMQSIRPPITAAAIGGTHNVIRCELLVELLMTIESLGGEADRDGMAHSSLLLVSLCVLHCCLPVPTRTLTTIQNM
jgi:hypothetical protein